MATPITSKFQISVYNISLASITHYNENMKSPILSLMWFLQIYEIMDI